MTTTTAPRRLGHLGSVLAVTPLLRWLIAHHTVRAGHPWRTRCEACAAAIWPAVCTPAGQCRICRTRVGAPPYLVEVLAVAAVGLLLASDVRGWELAAYTWWSLGLLVLAFVDAAVLRLPHRLTTATTAGTVVLLAPLGLTGSWRGALIGAGCMAGYYLAVHVASRGGIGLGDVAVAVPIGLGVGWLDWRLIIAVAVLGHGLGAATIVIRRLTHAPRVPLPLGTYLVAASFAVVVTAAAIR
nr:A24 family peptidase [Micromonospora sp. DSM 115978]